MWTTRVSAPRAFASRHRGIEAIAAMPKPGSRIRLWTTLGPDKEPPRCEGRCGQTNPPAMRARSRSSDVAPTTRRARPAAAALWTSTCVAAQCNENLSNRCHDRFGQESAASCDGLLIGLPDPLACGRHSRCTALWTSLVISLRAGITKPTEFRLFSRFGEAVRIGVDNCSNHAPGVSLRRRIGAPGASGEAVSSVDNAHRRRTAAPEVWERLQRRLQGRSDGSTHRARRLRILSMFHVQDSPVRPAKRPFLIAANSPPVDKRDVRHRRSDCARQASAPGACALHLCTAPPSGAGLIRSVRVQSTPCGSVDIPLMHSKRPALVDKPLSPP